jgi:hypothetical protein
MKWLDLLLGESRDSIDRALLETLLAAEYLKQLGLMASETHQKQTQLQAYHYANLTLARYLWVITPAKTRKRK